MKQQLLRMIEWHTQARHQWHLDTWHQGRFLEQWVAPEILQALPATFARYDEREVQGALHETLKLFHDLATTVAQDRGFTYPEETHAVIATWFEQMTRLR